MNNRESVAISESEIDVAPPGLACCFDTHSVGSCPRLNAVAAARLGGSRRARSRRGGIYIAVLGVALIVAVIGMASLQVSRIETRATVTANEIATARLMAQSAVEYALGQLDQAGSSWRTTFTHDVEVPPDDSWIALGDGEFKFVLLDRSDEDDNGVIDEDETDGVLADDSNDLVTIRGIGRSGGATSVTTITYAPAGEGLSCLEAVLHSVGQMNIDGATVDGTGFLSATGDVNGLSAATISLAVETSGTNSGGVFHEPVTTGAPVREIPDSAAVFYYFHYYLANGTWINYSDIPGGVIDRVVLTGRKPEASGNNPYGTGTTNSWGIYVIDCQGNDIVIQNSRIEGTLVLLNAGSGSTIAGRMHWEPAADNFPAMLVQGNLQMDWDWYFELDEAILDTNFNPTGSPFEEFEEFEDSDTNDSYPGVIKGLVYIAGNLNVTNNPSVEGVIVVGGQCAISEDLTLTYRDIFLNSPPPGFADGSQMRIVPGTWQRAANQE
jgi:hypothetical protein